MEAPGSPVIIFTPVRKVALLSTLSLLVQFSLAAEAPPYVSGKAFHILPGTTSEESGYFSLSESLDGAIDVGTAKYNQNAFLVEFDPRTETQRIVLDTNKTCGLTATGYAAQAKLHTRNFVGPSGRVYVGSKQGYAAKGDTSEYPGGYVMVYDPRVGRTENLGMPLKGQGVIDVVADEARNRIYVVTCEEQHWMVGARTGAPWKELGPMLTPYATTLVDSRGIANALGKDFTLAQFDPATEKILTRPIVLNGKVWTRAGNESIPIWQLDPDGRHAWLNLMNDPTLLWIDLQSAGDSVLAEDRGLMIEGEKPDCRSALTIHPDGCIYALERIQNNTGFGTGMLHHLVRYDPKTRRHEDLGVLRVENPDYFDWSSGPDGKPKPWTHGFHHLPDGALTPLHAHMGLLAARDGTLYATILYPYTLLKIDAYKLPPAKVTPARAYLDALRGTIAATRTRMPELTALAEKLAERHLHGGLIGFPWIGATLEQELTGRSGGLMHMGFDRVLHDRTPEEKANDTMIFAWDAAPKSGDLDRLRKEKANGLFIIGFGPKDSPALAEHVAACDAWIDSGGGVDDHAVALPDGQRIGKTNHFTNAVNGWVLIGEFVGALTRRGKMPVMWKSYATEDGHAWADRYFHKVQFHEDYTVPAQAAGFIGGAYLDHIDYLLARLENTQLSTLESVAAKIATELAEGRKTVVASSGHMVMNYVGRYDDALWAENHEVHGSVEAQVKAYEKTRESALVLRLGENGLEANVHEIFARLHQRVVLLTSENPRPEFALPTDCLLQVDYGGAFGDACVWLEGYPIPILPTTGVMQIAAYECVDTAVHALQSHSR